MTYLRKHDCKLPVYEQIWLADVDPKTFCEYWICDDCQQMWKRARTAQWREIETRVPWTGVMRWLTWALGMSPYHKTVQKVNSWAFRDWEPVSPEIKTFIRQRPENEDNQEVLNAAVEKTFMRDA